jgi:hypothetical protein
MTLLIKFCYIIIGFITLLTVKGLSHASKWLREACLLALSRHVEFPFSEAGFNGLKSLVKSDAHYHVVSFTYVVPKLL